MLNSIQSALAPIHRDGYRFVAIFFVVTLVLFYLDLEILAAVGLVLTVWCAYFFRDPERVTPLRQGLIVSPADGRVSALADVIPPTELDLGTSVRQRISIFMNVFDVHVNRSPVDGRLARLAYVPGTFVNADLDKASEDNERQALTIEMAGGERIGVVQIAGLLARRIVGFVKEGELLQTGQRFGIIRFGSRVDVYLPEGKASLVAVGQRAIAGETVLADLASAEPERPSRRS
ncbi:MAG: phosphatidylserine decarboxylase [Pseudomonadota bacterium]|nr:phosphatidylserine decarboxylase [Pseudomonadota bacterium]